MPSEVVWEVDEEGDVSVSVDDDEVVGVELVVGDEEERELELDELVDEGVDELEEDEEELVGVDDVLEMELLLELVPSSDDDEDDEDEDSVVELLSVEDALVTISEVLDVELDELNVRL